MMTDSLRAFYQEELRALRDDARDFSRQYPRIAPMLAEGGGEAADPTAERMLEATAFMAARMRLDSEARLPLAAQQLIGLLYPNFAAPIPSVSIARLVPEEGMSDNFPGGIDIPAGTAFSTRADGRQERIDWRTARDATLVDVRVLEAELLSRTPVGLANHPGRRFLRLRLSPLRGVDGLNLFLLGDSFVTYPLHTWVHLNCVDVLVSSRHGEDRYVQLGRKALQPGGLGENDRLFPSGDFALPAYQILQEYFVCPECFLFWDLAGIRGHGREAGAAIHLALAGEPPQELDIDPEMFVANAVPVVNLFEKLAEPLHVDHRHHSYLLQPDQRRRDTTEVHTILAMEALTPGGEPRRIKPYFSLDGDGRDDGLYWFARRRPAIGGQGTEMHLHFKDRELGVGRSRPYTVSARVLCTNRGQAVGLGVSAALEHNTELPLREARLVRPPTPQHRPPMLGDELYKLVSGISLHQVSLMGTNGLAALKELMRLYAPPGDAVSRVQIDGIVGLESRPDIQLLRPGPERPMGGAARGLEIRLLVDEDVFHGSSIFIFGSVMDQFFGLYSDINSFTRLRLYSTSRRKECHSWPARSGYRSI